MSMPAIAGGRLLMAFPDSKGDREHHLACFDLKTGKEIWRKPVAGEIITAPVIDDEQVFLATLEGSIYCFHAKDGSLAWTEKEKNVTSAPTLWNGRCWFSRRQETTITKAGKKVKQQMEQMAMREMQPKSPIHDLAATQRVADYLDYGKRGGFGPGGMSGGMGGMGGGMMAPASKKEAASQKADKGVGFDGGGIGVDEPPTQSTGPAKKPTASSGPPTQSSAVQQIGGKGDAKIDQAPRTSVKARLTACGPIRDQNPSSIEAASMLPWAIHWCASIRKRRKCFGRRCCVRPRRRRKGKMPPKARNSSTPPLARPRSRTAKSSLALATATWFACRLTKASCFGRQVSASPNPSVFNLRWPAVGSSFPPSPAAYTAWKPATPRTTAG